MTLTPKGRIKRDGVVSFGDASISIFEDGISAARDRGGYEGVLRWENQFKRDVFARIVQQLNRLGWKCVIPKDYISQYSLSFARNRRDCAKGSLKGWIEVSGRSITLEMWQSVNTPNRPDHGGKYEMFKELVMPYLLRLEMERTRRKIRDYLCNVFSGYSFKKSAPSLGVNGVDAMEWVKRRVTDCWHYKPEIGRSDGENYPYNCGSADSGTVKHGHRVWFYDRKGRVNTGVAHYNINNMWWVICGRYSVENKASFYLYTSQPENLRVKKNYELRFKRLKQELDAAVKIMNFERAIILRDEIGKVKAL